jgi:DNA topoisomerase-1
VAEDLATGRDDGDPDSLLLRAIDATAEKLGNTREVCRSSYLHPLIPQAFRDGSLQPAWARSRRGSWLGRAESTVNRLIAEAGNGAV